MYIKYYFIN